MAAATQVGAFPLAAGSADSAVLTTVNAGSYSLQVAGATNESGVALAELYDDGPAIAARLINVSARAQTGTGAAALSAGFVIGGTGSKTMLIRAIGPTLAAFGVSGVLADPRIDVYAAGATSPLAGNDNWGGTVPLTLAFQQVQAFPLDPASKDAAILVTVGPGAYTAVVSGVNGTTGVALLEVYDVQ